MIVEKYIPLFLHCQKIWIFKTASFEYLSVGHVSKTGIHKQNGSLNSSLQKQEREGCQLPFIGLVSKDNSINHLLLFALSIRCCSNLCR